MEQDLTLKMKYYSQVSNNLYKIYDSEEYITGGVTTQVGYSLNLSKLIFSFENKIIDENLSEFVTSVTVPTGEKMIADMIYDK